MFGHFNFIPLLIVAACAWLIPILTSRLRVIRLPSVTMEILAGVILGTSGLNLIQGETYLNFLAEYGFLMLMFLSGLEIDTQQILATLPRRSLGLKASLRNPIMMGSMVLVLSLLLSATFAFSLLFFAQIQHVWYVTLLMATTSVGIVVPILKERGEMSGRFGQILMLCAVAADITTVFLLTITAIIIARGFNLEALVVLLMFPALYLAYISGRFITGKNLFKRISHELSHASSQIKVRGTLVLMLIFLVLADNLVGAELILGAFFAGLVLSFFTQKDRSTLLLKLDGMAYGFFVPIFFIMVGANFDFSALQALENSEWFLIYLVFAAFAIKVLPAVITFKAEFGFRRALAGGFLLSSRLSLVIAAAGIGLELGLISPALNAAFILLAWATCLISPTIYSRLAQVQATSEQILIVGAGRVGRELSRRLKMHGKNSTLIDCDPAVKTKAEESGLEVVVGDACDEETFALLQPDDRSHGVVVTGDDETNIKIAEFLKNRFGMIKIIARDKDPANSAKLTSLGFVPMNQTMSLAITLENLLMRPQTYSALVESFDSYEAEEIRLTNRSIHRKQVSQIPLPRDGFLLLVNREGELQIPHGDTMLRAGDILTVFGTTSTLTEFRRIFQ